MLRAPCDAAIKVLFARGQMSTQAAAAESGSTSVSSAEQEVDDVCFEVTACRIALNAGSCANVQGHAERTKACSAAMADLDSSCCIIIWS